MRLASASRLIRESPGRSVKRHFKTIKRSHWRLTSACRTIKTLMDAKADTDDQDLKVALSTLEYAARKQRRAIEERLAVRN